MRKYSLSGRIGIDGLLATLLMLHTSADDSKFTISQYQKDNFHSSSSVPLGDPYAGPFGNLLGSDGLKIGSSWTNDDAGLKMNSDPQDGNEESPLLADTNTACPNRGRLRQSRQGKRDQKEPTVCKWPYTGSTTTTPEAQEGEAEEGGAQEEDPGKPQPDRPWPKLTDTTSKADLWLQLFSARGIEAKINLKVCNRNGLCPVCYPNKIAGLPPLVSPALTVEPCRFWSELDPCQLEQEELWCCQYAKERPVDDVLLINILASSFGFDMRYHGTGMDCQTLDNPEINNLGRDW